VTERDRFWLEHEAAIAASGQTAKAYAAEHGLSLHALYQSRKRRRALEQQALKPVERTSPSKADRKSVSFSRVDLRSPQPTAADFRLSLPNGFVLEWSGPELPEGVVALVDRLTSPR
jgi:hypothetical protein